MATVVLKKISREGWYYCSVCSWCIF